jgi:hypothetical protein
MYNKNTQFGGVSLWEEDKSQERKALQEMNCNPKCRYSKEYILLLYYPSF